MGYSAYAWLYFLQSQIQENGGWSLGEKYTLRVDEDKEEVKTVAQEVMEAREFVMETTRNAWVPDDMKRKIEKHITKLCNAIECQERSLNKVNDMHIKLRGEWKHQQDIISSILKLSLDFERINPVPTMSKLTKQCIDAYNTCVAIKDMVAKDAKDKMQKDIESEKPRAVLD